MSTGVSKLNWFVVFLLLAILVAAALHLAFIRPMLSARMAYYQDWTLRILIDHMAQNDFEFPENWSDLRESHSRVSASLGGISPLDEIRSAIIVDFEFNPQNVQFEKRGEESKVISPRNGDSYHWRGEEPNAALLNWIRQNRGEELVPQAVADGPPTEHPNRPVPANHP